MRLAWIAPPALAFNCRYTRADRLIACSGEVMYGVLQFLWRRSGLWNPRFCNKCGAAILPRFLARAECCDPVMAGSAIPAASVLRRAPGREALKVIPLWWAWSLFLEF